VSTAQASGVKDKGAPSAIESLFLGERLKKGRRH